MSLLRSYGFSDEVDPRAYLGLVAMQENPSAQFDCTIEYLNAVQRGEFNLDKFEEAAKRDELKGEFEGVTHYDELKKEFNLKAYDYKVKEIRKKGVRKSDKKKFHICEASEDGTVDAYGVLESVVTECAGQKDAYEDFLNEDELSYAVRTLYSFQGRLMTEARIDIIHTLRTGFEGNSRCREKSGIRRERVFSRRRVCQGDSFQWKGSG